MPKAKTVVPQEKDNHVTPLRQAAKIGLFQTPRTNRKRKAVQGGASSEAATVESVRIMVAKMVEEHAAASETAFQSIERAAAKEIRETTERLTDVNKAIAALGKGANTKLTQLARDGESMASGLESAMGEFLQFINTDGACVQPFKKFRRETQQKLGELESKY